MARINQHIATLETDNGHVYDLWYSMPWSDNPYLLTVTYNDGYRAMYSALRWFSIKSVLPESVTLKAKRVRL